MKEVRVERFFSSPNFPIQSWSVATSDNDDKSSMHDSACSIVTVFVMLDDMGFLHRFLVFPQRYNLGTGPVNKYSLLQMSFLADGPICELQRNSSH